MEESSEQKEKQGSFFGNIIRFFRRLKNRERQPQAQAKKDKEDIEEAKKKFRRFFTLRFWKTTAVDPNSKFIFYWTFINMLAVFYNGMFVMMRAAFEQTQYPGPQFVARKIDTVCDVIYLIDMFVRSRKGFLEHGLMVDDARRLTKAYLKSYYFIVDILTVLPIDWLQPAYTSTSWTLRLNRGGRIRRIFHFFHMAEVRSNYPKFVRVLNLVVYILIMIHLNACIYFSISKNIGIITDAWVYPAMQSFEYDVIFEKLHDFWYEYLFSFFWSTLTLTAIGETQFPAKTNEAVYCIVCALAGVLIFAAVFGNVGALINDMNRKKTEYRKRVDTVKEYMEIHKVPENVQTKFLEWFRYTWKNKQSVDAIEVLKDLPEKTRADLGLCIHIDTLRDTKLFKFCESGFLEELVLKLRWQVFSPDDYICRRGDIGNEMYIIKHGYLEVLDQEGLVVAKLTDGQIFGEISVLDIPGNITANCRTADVKAVGFVDLLCLAKKDLWMVLEDFPTAKKILIEKGKAILRKDKYLDEQVNLECEKQISEMDMVEMLNALIVENDIHIDEGNEYVRKKGQQQLQMMEKLRHIRVLVSNMSGRAYMSSQKAADVSDTQTVQQATPLEGVDRVEMQQSSDAGYGHLVVEV